MDNFIIHRSPDVVGGDTIKSIREMNSGEFDFAQHFEKETIAKSGRWWVCLKAKPWTTCDLMIIDSTKEFARSIGELDEQDLKKLARLIAETVKVLEKTDSNRLIVVGANINPYTDLADSESIARLHIHVCGFSEKEIGNFENANSVSFFEDEVIEEFKKSFDFSGEGFEPYELGVKLKIGNLDEEGIVALLEKINSEVKPELDRVKSTGKFSVLSYSFAIKMAEGSVELFISPKSQNGRGVLESFGIILKRDVNLKSNADFIKLRDEFLEKVKIKLLQNPDITAGKAKLEENG